MDIRTLGVVVEMVEGRARERGQLAGFGGVYAGPPVEVLGTVGGATWQGVEELKSWKFKH